MRMKLLYYNCTFALFIFRLHKLGIEAHAYAHYTSLLCLLCFTKTVQKLSKNSQSDQGAVARFCTIAAITKRFFSSLWSPCRVPLLLRRVDTFSACRHNDCAARIVGYDPICMRLAYLWYEWCSVVVWKLFGKPVVWSDPLYVGSVFLLLSKGNRIMFFLVVRLSSDFWSLVVLYMRSDYLSKQPETRGQSNLSKSASRGAHSPVRGHPRGVEICTIEFLG